MNPNAARYKPPGDIYQSLENEYGRNGALLVAQAAQSSDPTAVSAAISRVKYGARLDDSTASNLWRQLTTDPLAAPLEGLNNQIGKAVWNVVKNPFVLLLVAALVYFWLLPKLKLR